MNTCIIFCIVIACVLAQENLELKAPKKEHHSSYKFAYGVEDHHTGDIKSHHEHKHKKEVTGVYTLKEADGTTRVVKYHSGPHKGFHAEVERIGHAQHPDYHIHGKKGEKVKKIKGGSSYVGTTYYGYEH